MNKIIDETKVDTHRVDDTHHTANQSSTPTAPAQETNGAKKKPNHEKVYQIATDQLKFSEFSLETYGQDVPGSLIASITEEGVITPLIVNRKTSEVISGNSRLGAAKQLKLLTVPVVYTEIEDPLKVREYVLETNRHRERTTEQKIKEFKAYKKIEAAKAKERQKTNSSPTDPLVENLTQADPGKSRDKAAARVGMSGVSLEKGEKVLDAITTLPESDVEKAKQLIATLNTKSINAAFKVAKDFGLIILAAKKQKKAAADGVKVAAKEVGVTPVEIAAPAKDLEHEEPGPLDSEDSPKITSHRQAMRTLDDIIEYVEVLNYDNLTDGQRAEWSESIEAFSSALAAAGLMKNG